MRKDGIQTRKRKPKSQKGSGPKEEIKTEGLLSFQKEFQVFVKYVQAGCFEGFVARRLFGSTTANSYLSVCNGFKFSVFGPTHKKGKGTECLCCGFFCLVEDINSNKC